MATAQLTPCSTSAGHVQPPCRARLHRLPVFARQGDRSASSCRASTASRLCGVAAAAAVLLSSGHAQANTAKVAEWAASGLIFKDSIELIALDDKDVEGVTIYITDFKRSITEKLAKDFFAEPSQASLTCAVTGPVSFNADKVKSGDGQEIFAERKNLLNLIQNKTLRVRRVYDEKNNTLIYIAYSTRFTSSNDEGVSTGRYRTSVCALPLATAPTLAAEPAVAEAVAQ